jgi:hypothetical protein
MWERVYICTEGSDLTLHQSPRLRKDKRMRHDPCACRRKKNKFAFSAEKDFEDFLENQCLKSKS